MPSLGLALVVTASCNWSEETNKPSPPDIFPLVPNIVDGATLKVAPAPMEFFFGSSTLESFSLVALGIWSGEQLEATLEPAGASATRSYFRASRVLEPGSYELRVSVADRIRPEQMSQFKPVSKQVWSIGFFVGSRFCILRAGVCREIGAERMAVAVRFSTSTSAMPTEVATRVMRLEYDSTPTTCSLAFETRTVSGVELNYRCALPTKPVGNASIVFSSELASTDGEPLTTCSGTPASPVQLSYDQAGCGSYSWR